jgi:hypothetical protein
MRLINRVITDRLLWIAAGMVAAWRIALELVNFVEAHFIYPQASLLETLQHWSKWDGGWYLSINNYGYMHASGTIQQENVAFFPGFPQTAGGIAHVLHVEPFYVGIILNVILTVGSVYVLMKLATLFAHRYNAGKHARRIALLSAAVLLAYPASFFFAAYYAEALLIFATLAAVYMTATRRLWWAVPFLAIATASKVTGVIVVATCMVMVLEQWIAARQPFRTLVGKLAIIAAGVSGLLAYMTYLWVRFGDPILFYKIQKTWGRNDDVFFVKRLVGGWYMHFFDHAHWPGIFEYSVNIFVMVLPFIVAAAVFIIWRTYKVYWPIVLALLALGIPLSTGIMDSINRYCLILAPIIPLIVIWAQRKLKPWMVCAILGLSGLAMLYYTFGFFREGWFAG